MCACGHTRAEHIEVTTEEMEPDECEACKCQQFTEPEPYSALAEEAAEHRAGAVRDRREACG
jgi:hypothetical protein